jgi:uncharacterized glyoxalase superfamily protein PhnB
MYADVEEPGRTIVPTLRYRDVAAAIDWLSRAFGFEKRLVVPDDNGAVRYAELTFGDGMIMLGPVEDSAFDKLMTQPADAGGAETQICYLFVADAGAHRARAKAAGAEIVLDIEEEDGGGRGYSCRDLEGHIWNFGTYNPWKRQSAQADGVGHRDRRSNARRGLRRAAVVAGLLVTVAVSALAVEWAMGATDRASVESEPVATTGAPPNANPKSEHEQLARAREAAERAIKDVRDQLAKERSARETAERAAKEAREQLAKAGTQQAANEVREMREELAREKGALATAQRIAQETREQLALTERAAEALQEQLAAERSAREAAQRDNQQAQELLAKEQSAKEEAERAKQARERAAKEKAAKEAAERAAEEARERQRNARRPAYRPQATAEPTPPVTPFTIWPR